MPILKLSESTSNVYLNKVLDWMYLVALHHCTAVTVVTLSGYSNWSWSDDDMDVKVSLKSYVIGFLIVNLLLLMMLLFIKTDESISNLTLFVAWSFSYQCFFLSRHPGTSETSVSSNCLSLWSHYNRSKHSLFTDPFIFGCLFSPLEHIWFGGLLCLRNNVFSGVLGG